MLYQNWCNERLWHHHHYKIKIKMYFLRNYFENMNYINTLKQWKIYIWMYNLIFDIYINACAILFINMIIIENGQICIFILKKYNFFK